MKYEEIKIGDVFGYGGDEETVISKSEQYRIITTIDTDMTPSAFKEKELHYLKPIKEELLEEGLLVHKDGTIVYRTGERYGYGFDSNKDYENLDYGDVGWTFYITPQEWRKATEQEEEKFVEMLWNEWVRMGNDENTKIERHADDTPLRSRNFMRVHISSSTEKITNKNGIIFYKGKFATPLKETTTTPQVGKQYIHKKVTLTLL